MYYVARMDDERLPKTILCSHLEHGHWNKGCLKLRFKDTLKRNITLRNLNIDHNTWYNTVTTGQYGELWQAVMGKLLANCRLLIEIMGGRHSQNSSEMIDNDVVLWTQPFHSPLWC